MVAAREYSRRDPTDPMGAGSTDIEHVHRAIRGLLDQLGDAKNPEQVLEALDRLAPLLMAHFSGEEAAGGLFEELETARPANSSRVRGLRREHRAILGALEELRREARQAQECLARIESEKSAFILAVGNHEETENCLVMDTHLVDSGAVD